MNCFQTAIIIFFRAVQLSGLKKIVYRWYCSILLALDLIIGPAFVYVNLIGCYILVIIHSMDQIWSLGFYIYYLYIFKVYWSTQNIFYIPFIRPSC